MSFESIPFFHFLGLCVLLLAFVPAAVRPWIILGSSLLWCASWSVVWSCVYFSIILGNFYFLRRFPESAKILLSADALTYVILKIPSLTPVLPPGAFGQSFVFFLLMALVIHTQRVPLVERPRLLEFLTIPLFFPLLMAGPLERIPKFLAELRMNRAPNLVRARDGSLGIFTGVLKLILVCPFLKSVEWALLDPVPEFLLPLTGGILMTFRLYYELSGFADIGRGVARIIGIDLSINFRPFYFSTGVRDFWLRWNITVGFCIRDNVIFPLLLRFGRSISSYVLLFLSFLIMGIWHEVTGVWLIFGLWNGFWVCFETWIAARKLHWIPQRLLAWILIAGNGVIPVWGVFSQRPPELLFPYWHSTAEAATTWLSVSALVFIFAGELIQEAQKKPEWYEVIPERGRWVVAVLAMAILLWFFDLEFMREAITEPVYFRV